MLKDIILGIKHAWYIPSLPQKVSEFYSHIFTRIFRFVGGVAILITVTKGYDYIQLNNYFNEIFCDIIIISTYLYASIFITFTVVINLIKIIYTIYLLKNKPETFEVRNSPLNMFASPAKLANVLTCIKIGCIATGSTAAVVAGGVAFLTGTINQSLTWKIQLLNDQLESTNNLGNDSVNVKSGVAVPPSMSIVPFFSKILNTRIIKYILYIILLVNVYIFYPKLVGYFNYSFCLYFIFIFSLIIFYNIFNIILYIYIMDYKGSIKDHKILNKLPNFLLEKYLVFNNSKSKDFLIPHFFKLLIFYILMLLILIIINLILVYLIS